MSTKIQNLSVNTKIQNLSVSTRIQNLSVSTKIQNFSRLGEHKDTGWFVFTIPPKTLLKCP